MAYEPRGLAVISGSSDARFKVLDDGTVELKGNTLGGLAVTSGSIMMAGANGGGTNPYPMQAFDIRGAHGATHIGESSSNSTLQTALTSGGGNDSVSYALTYIYENAAAAIGDLSDTVISGEAGGHVLIYDGTNSWDNKPMSGDATLDAAGALTIAADAVEGTMLNDNVISGQTELAHADIADADELMISDGGTLKKVGLDSLQNHYFAAISGDATVADGGALTIAAAAVENSMLADNAVGADELAADAVVEASIVDNAVTLAKMAGLARGKIIVGDASGDPSALAAGANGKLLVADANGDPTWTTVSGDATLSAGALTISANAVEGSMLNNNTISGQTALGSATAAQADELLFSDAGTLKRITFSNLEDSIFGNVSGDAAIAAGGALTIAAQAVENSMLADNAVGSDEIADNAVLTAHITDANVTLAKLANLADMKVIGNASGGSAAPSAISILDEGDLASNSATALATQQSIKTYVDSVSAGLDPKESVVAATTASFTMASTATANTLVLADGEGGFSASGDTLTIDGVSVPTTSRVLIKDGVNSNSAGVHNKWNGIYTVGALSGATLTLTRATDADATAEITGGLFTFVEQGTTNADAGFVCTSDAAITVGTTAITFAQFSGAGAFSAGAGITKTGSTFSVTTAGVTNAMLADDAVGADELAADAVVNASIAANAAIDMDKLDGSSLATALTDFAQDDLVVLADQSDSFNLKKITTSNFEDAIFGNVSGDATIAAGGALTITSDAVEQSMIADNAVGADQLASDAVVTASIVDDNVTNAKLANMTQGTIKVGGGSNAPTDLDAKTSGQILVGDGTDIASVAVSGDATLAANGALTIAAGAVEHGMLADNIISGQANLGGTGVDDADEFMLSDGGTIKALTGANLYGWVFSKVSGDATIAAGGALTITSDAVEQSMIADNAVGADQLASDAVVTASIVDDNVTNAKLANMTEGTIKVGGGSNAPTDLDAKTSGQIIVGNGTGVASVAVSGDATLAANGALTIASGAVEHGMLAEDIISGQAALGSASVAQADLLMLDDGPGTVKKVTFSNFEDSIFGNVSSDAAIAAGGALTIAADAVTNAKLANMTQGTIKVGGGSNAPTDLDAKTSGQIIVGDGTGVASVAVSGDATLAANGALTIANDAVEQAMIADNAVGADQLASDAVVTASIVDANVTHAKFQSIATMTVVGRTAAGTGVTSAVSILDEDDLSTNSATALATQQSIKAYVDSVASGLDVKDSVHLATTAALAACTYANGTSGVGATLTADANGALSIDGVAVVSGDRLLIKDQSTAAQNGIYTVTNAGADGSAAFVLTRATDADTTTELTAGAFTFVEEGTTNADNGFVMTTNGAITMGSTAVAWGQFSGAGSITAGAGLAKSGSTLSLNIDTLSALSDVGNLHQTDDHFLISDGGTEKKITFSDLEDEIFGNISGDASVAAGGALTIANDAVEQAMIADNAVGADQLASDAVVNASVTDGSLKADKLDIDGSTDIGAALADADLFLVDDGAGGTNRKSAMSRVPTYVFTKVSGDATVASNGALTIANDAVEQAMIADNAVGADQLATDAVVNASIVDGTIAFAKLADAANIARLDQNETATGIYTFGNTTEATMGTGAITGSLLTAGGLGVTKGLHVRGAANSTIAQLGNPEAGGFIDYRQNVRLGGSLQLAKINGSTNHGQDIMCDLSDATALTAGHYDGYMVYVLAAMDTNSTRDGALNDSDNTPRAKNNFDVANKFYFCEEGVWHMSPFATAAEE
jgi:hypothetical protein